MPSDGARLEQKAPTDPYQHPGKYLYPKEIHPARHAAPPMSSYGYFLVWEWGIPGP
jgi:hypothetical protein